MCHVYFSGLFWCILFSWSLLMHIGCLLMYNVHFSGIFWCTLFSCSLFMYTVYLTGWQRLTGSRIFIDHFPQKWPIFNGSFVDNDLQLRGSYESSPPRIVLFWCLFSRIFFWFMFSCLFFVLDIPPRQNPKTTDALITHAGLLVAHTSRMRDRSLLAVSSNVWFMLFSWNVPPCILLMGTTALYRVCSTGLR